MTRALLKVAAAASLVGACSDGAGNSGASDAGKDLPDVVRRDAAAPPDGSDPDVGRRDAARPPDAHVKPADADAAPACSADDAPADAGLPPVDCVPPCLQKIVRYCPQPTEHSSGPGVFPESAVTTDYYAADGCYCLQISRGGIPPSTRTMVWSDPSGRSLARTMFQSVNPAFFGILCGDTPYMVSLQDPKCEPWSWLYSY